MNFCVVQYILQKGTAFPRIRGKAVFIGSIIKVRSICWGNYFGPDYCKSYNLNSKLVKLMSKEHAPSVMKEIADGIFITLTSSPMDYDTEECWQKRAKLMNCMGI